MKHNQIYSNNVKQIAFLGLFFALAIVLSLIESTIPAIPFLPPGVKLGLANIVVMYCLFFLKPSYATYIVFLKAIFVLLIRGVTAGFLSFCGGMFSLLIMCVFMRIFKKNISYFALSVLGGVFHNIGQFIAISIFFNNLALIAYLPILVIMGILAGLVSSSILKIILPALTKALKH